MSQFSGAFVILKKNLALLQTTLKEHNYHYVIIPAKNENWIYFVLDVREDAKEVENDADTLKWSLNLDPSIIKDCQEFSKAFPILFLELDEDYGWEYLFFSKGLIKGGYYLDYEKPSIKRIKEKIRNANIQALGDFEMNEEQIQKLENLLEGKKILNDAKNDLENSIFKQFLGILGLEDFGWLSWAYNGYISDPEFLCTQHDLLLKPLKKFGFQMYKTSDIGRICEDSILQYIEFQKSGYGGGSYYVNVWIRPLFSDYNGIGGRLNEFKDIQIQNGSFWSEKTKEDLRLFTDIIMVKILSWFEKHTTVEDLIRNFEERAEKQLEMENWNPYDIAMLYLWIKNYEMGTKYLEISLQHALEGEWSVVQKTCKNLLSHLKNGEFGQIRKIQEGFIKDAKENLAKMQENFHTFAFGSTFWVV